MQKLRFILYTIFCTIITNPLFADNNSEDFSWKEGILYFIGIWIGLSTILAIIEWFNERTKTSKTNQHTNSNTNYQNEEFDTEEEYDTEEDEEDYEDDDEDENFDYTEYRKLLDIYIQIRTKKYISDKNMEWFTSFAEYKINTGKPLPSAYTKLIDEIYRLDKEINKKHQKRKEKTPYEILGVNENATKEEIKKAYHALIKKYHPDVNHTDKKAEEIIKEINNAYDILMKKFK